MGSFITNRLLALSVVLFAVLLPANGGISAGGPIEFAAALIGGFVGAVVFASVLKVAYIGISKTVAKAQEPASS